MATVLVAVAVSWTLRKIEAQLKDQIAESVQTIVATTQEGIQLWINDAENPASLVARRPRVISAIQSQLQIASHPDLLRRSAALGDLREFLAPVVEPNGYQFSVVDHNGVQLAADTDEAVGTKLNEANQRPIQSALNGRIAVGLTSTNDPSAAHVVIVAAPVKIERSGVQAALVLFIDPTEDFNGITRRGRIGNTGETYVFDSQGRMLTDSRFRPDRSVYVGNRVDATKPGSHLTKMAESALSGHSGVDVQGYSDYRGIDVFGAWAWNPVLNVGIATEMDAAEALTPYRSIRALTLLLLSLIVVTFVLLLVLIHHRNRALASNWAFQQSIQARQDTLAVVSHDLRAPLGNVILCSTMLSKQDYEPADVTRFAEMMNRSARQMEKLISDLLDVSEMEMGRLRIEKKLCRIGALLEPIRDIFTEQAHAKSIELDIPEPSENLSVLADADRLIQVLSNMIGNAIKFTPAGGKVSVRAVALPNEVRFEVRDTGPGVPPDAQRHVFDQFWKTRSSGKRGRGLGLYIARMIVQGHNGKIWVESDGKTGSTFYFCIPR